MAFKKRKVATSKVTRKIYKVDVDGRNIEDLAKFKKDNPGALYFDSKFERHVYLVLEESGIEYTYKPESIEYQQRFQTQTLSMVKGKPEFKKHTVSKMVYSADFLIDSIKTYLEPKGYFREPDRMRIKLSKNKLRDHTFVVLKQDDPHVWTKLEYIIDYAREHTQGRVE